MADEAVSALDASTQAQVADLFVQLVRSLGLGLLFISHDLSVVHRIADTVAVMYLGRIVERGPTGAVWDTHAHPYSEALIAAVPRLGPDAALPAGLAGEVPDPADPRRAAASTPAARTSSTAAAPTTRRCSRSRRGTAPRACSSRTGAPAAPPT